MGDEIYIEKKKATGVLDFGLDQLAKSFEEIVSKVRLNHHAFNTNDGQPIDGDIINKGDFSLVEVAARTGEYLLEFSVPSNVNLIRKLELLNADDDTLTRHTLHVPIETNARFRYVLTFMNALNR